MQELLEVALVTLFCVQPLVWICLLQSFSGVSRRCSTGSQAPADSKTDFGTAGTGGLFETGVPDSADASVLTAAAIAAAAATASGPATLGDGALPCEAGTASSAVRPRSRAAS